MEENSLAFEMLKELKSQNRRMFIIIVILATIIISMFVGFVVYESQFEYTTSVEQTQKVEDIDTSDVNQTIN